MIQSQNSFPTEPDRVLSALSWASHSAPRFQLNVAMLEHERGAQVCVRMLPSKAVLSVIFESASAAAKAVEQDAFITAVVWKLLPALEDSAIDEVVEGFIKPEHLYDSERTFNQQSEHILRGVGVVTITAKHLH